MRKRRRVDYLSAQNEDGLKSHHTREREINRERGGEGDNSVNMASLPAGPMEHGDDIMKLYSIIGRFGLVWFYGVSWILVSQHAINQKCSQKIARLGYPCVFCHCRLSSTKTLRNARKAKRKPLKHLPWTVDVRGVFGPSVICSCHIFLFSSLRFNVIDPSELRLCDLSLLPAPRPVLCCVYAKSTNHRMEYKRNGEQ